MKYLRGCAEKVMRGEERGILSSLLLILSIVYDLSQRMRCFLYEKGLVRVEKIEPKVISIGNITTGGTGKTPAVMSVAEMAKEKGFKVAILTRGYMGKAKGIKPVSDSSGILLDCRDAGDEPYLMAKRLKGIPIIKGKDRYLSARFAVERFGSGLLILDDGYQHLKLHRDTNILLIDATDPFGNGHLLPRGMLREPLASIRRADAVVLTKSDLSQKNSETIKTIRRHNPSAPIFFSYYRPLDLVSLEGDIMPIEDIKGRSLFLFSGLANHSSFKSLIEMLGAVISGELIYPDHFYYSEGDIEEIGERAEADMIVTTEKDMVKIPQSGIRTRIWALRIEFSVEDRKNWESLLFRDGSSVGGDN